MKIKIFIVLALFFPLSVMAEFKAKMQYGFSHIKPFSFSSYRNLIGNDQQIHALSGRLMYSKDWGSLSFSTHYEALAITSEDLIFFESDADSKRLFNLDQTLESSDKSSLYHRVDRLSLSYTQDKTVVKLGRQALSWGNGFVFQPTDIVNPFSPIAVDKEYKTGDDMLFFEQLLPSGSDINFVLVPRRKNGAVEEGESTYALKYRTTIHDSDVSFAGAKDYEERLFFVSISSGILDTVSRIDVITNTESLKFDQWALVANGDYSWIWFNKNFYGFAEYYYQDGRVLKQGGFVFEDKEYWAIGLRAELHPFVNVSPTFMGNFNDGSSLTTLGINFDWKSWMNLSLTANLPYGGEGTEFGGEAAIGETVTLLVNAYF
ncbi:MAG: hypothetical protein OEZ47_12860 [Gammaproteobacteria bacterium]|nr:hypothetical protein [Gammaproteobacteria bacterium]